MAYEAVIGMEVHAQILTGSKMFCACSADYAGAPPNAHTCPTCLGMPGALPTANQAADGSWAGYNAVNSTAVMGGALASGGQDQAGAIAFLTGAQADSGAFTSNGADDMLATTQATLLLAGAITGGTYTGVAATWARRELEPGGSVAFIVELGETLSPLEASTHAQAVRTIAVEG